MPKLIARYNQFMGGVDILDSMEMSMSSPTLSETLSSPISVKRVISCATWIATTLICMLHNCYRYTFSTDVGFVVIYIFYTHSFELDIYKC